MVESPYLSGPSAILIFWRA